jgi:hypothetical protein
MQLLVRVGERELVTLLDSSSTHNFVNEELAAQLGSHFTVGRRLHVTVANGDHVTCGGLLRQAAITIGHKAFVVDLYAIPLGGFDVVLGTRWLKTLGPILWDFTRLWMSFWRSNHRVEWYGIAVSTKPRHIHVCSGQDLLDSLLASYTDVFTEPRGLPPPRAHDHRIRLVPGTAPHQWPFNHIVTQPSRKTSSSDNALTCWSVALYVIALPSFPRLFSW